MDIPTKPTWKNLAESDRSEHTALRHRMLCGTWYQDLIDAMNMHVSLERQEAWGNPDMSSNIFKETTKALCALYLKPPVVTDICRAPSSQIQERKRDRLKGFWVMREYCLKQVYGV